MQHNITYFSQNSSINNIDLTRKTTYHITTKQAGRQQITQNNDYFLIDAKRNTPEVIIRVKTWFTKHFTAQFPEYIYPEPE